MPNQNIEVPQESLDMLKHHLSSGILSVEFLHGYCSCLAFQYSNSSFSKFYDYHSVLANQFPTKLKQFLDSGTSAPPLSSQCR